MSAARQALDSTISEKDFQQQVVEFALLRGWLVYHTYRSTRSEPGYPDLTLVRGEFLIFAELKREGGHISTAQRVWLNALDTIPGGRRSRLHLVAFIVDADRTDSHMTTAATTRTPRRQIRAYPRPGDGDFALPLDERADALRARIANVNAMLAWYEQVAHGLRRALFETEAQMTRAHQMHLRRLGAAEEHQAIQRYLKQTAS